jgi:hypothetical protein
MCRPGRLWLRSRLRTGLRLQHLLRFVLQEELLQQEVLPPLPVGHLRLPQVLQEELLQQLL